MSAPILTRLYTPEDFGLFAVFSAFAAITAVVIGLRYELSIPLEQDDQIAAALVAGVGLTSVSISLLACLLLWLWGAWLAALLGVPELAPLFWLLPPCMMLWGLGNALSFWSIRQGTFRLNGINRMAQYGAQASGQLVFGVAALGGTGLILGYALGYLTRFVHLLVALPRADLRAFCRPSPAEVWQGLRYYWRYPAFSASSSILQSSCNMLPAVMVAALYGPAMAGFYALAQRVVALPFRLLSDAASQVFLGEIRSRDHKGMLRLFKRTVGLFVGLGVLGLLPLAAVAPWLFAIVFGEAWRETGTILQLLTPLYLVRFVVTPVSQALNALQRQDLHLAAALMNGVAFAASFTIGWQLSLDYQWTIGLFSAGSSMAFIFYIMAAWRNLQRADWQALQQTDRSGKPRALTDMGASF